MQISATVSPAVREIPGRSEAERALAAAFESGRHSFAYALVYLPDHVLELLDSGDWQTADRVLMAACRDLVQMAPRTARVYRWTATALLAVVEEAGGTPGDPGRWRIFPLAEARSPGDLCRELDEHIARSL